MIAWRTWQKDDIFMQGEAKGKGSAWGLSDGEKKSFTCE
jgi:hypothetical protein